LPKVETHKGFKKPASYEKDLTSTQEMSTSVSVPPAGFNWVLEQVSIFPTLASRGTVSLCPALIINYNSGLIMSNNPDFNPVETHQSGVSEPATFGCSLF